MFEKLKQQNLRFLLENAVLFDSQFTIIQFISIEKSKQQIV